MFPIPSPYAWDRHRGHPFDAIAGGGCRPCSLLPKEMLMAAAPPASHPQQRWAEFYAEAAATKSSPLRIGEFCYQGGAAAGGRGEGPQGFLLYAAGGAPAAGLDEALLPRADVANHHWMARGYGVCGQDQAFLSSGDLQAMGASGMAAGRSNESSPSLPMEESSFRVGRLSPEERKEKIHRYMKKRNERNFSKKIKYACRKTLADSRPRVRGRFAKNDEDGELTKPCSSSHDFDDEEEQVAVKEEDILDSDILAHISGFNSVAYSFALDSSWI